MQTECCKTKRAAAKKARNLSRKGIRFVLFVANTEWQAHLVPTMDLLAILVFSRFSDRLFDTVEADGYCWRHR